MIVLDNGRSRVRESDEREILNCIRCGSCLTVCPVYSKVGGHAYGSVYGGPIGAVLTPLLTDMQPGPGPQAAVPLVALRRLHRRLPGRHPAARPARARPRAGQPRRRRRARRARGLGRVGARLVEPAAVPRLGARRRALGAVRARLRAGRELARGARDAAAAEHEAVPPALERPGERRVIDAFIAAVRGRRRRRGRASRTSPPRATYVAELLGRDATLCFWSGDPLVMSLDPASLGRETTPAEAGAGITGADFGVAAHGHARADLRRGPLAHDRPPARPAHRAAARRPHRARRSTRPSRGSTRATSRAR